MIFLEELKIIEIKNQQEKKSNFLPSSAQTKVFYDMEYFNGFVPKSKFIFFTNDQIDVYISMDKITISWPPDSAFNAHQAMFLKTRLRVHIMIFR